MLKVQSINNNSNIAFQGTFIKNNLLDKTIEYANTSELIRFKEHLKAMMPKKDDKIFSLTKEVKNDFLGKTQFLRLCENNQSRNNSYIVGSELKINDLPFGDNCYINALKKINDILNRYYPIADPVENRGTLIKVIESYLQHQ